jgi:hypoxanthine phosphoribosyltransferase
MVSQSKQYGVNMKSQTSAVENYREQFPIHKSTLFRNSKNRFVIFSIWMAERATVLFVDDLIDSGRSFLGATEARENITQFHF